jgi:hypothetical protein
LDFIWGTRAPNYLYTEIIDFIKDASTNFQSEKSNPTEKEPKSINGHKPLERTELSPGEENLTPINEHKTLERTKTSPTEENLNSINDHKLLERTEAINDDPEFNRKLF